MKNKNVFGVFLGIAMHIIAALLALCAIAGLILLFVWLCGLMRGVCA